jgi:hypothetical protein
MKKLRKIGAIVLAVMMIAVMATAWADDDNVWTGSDDGTGLATTRIGTNTIPLNKTVVIFNTEDGTTVREPDITFSYAIAKVDSTLDPAAQLESTVTDGTNTVNVYNGVPAAISAPSNIVYANTNTVAATTKGFEDEKSTNITVDATAFPHAGIYRYKITESSSVTPESVGMEAHTDAYDSTRYLDVYIYNPDATHTTMWLGAAVIFKTQATTNSDKGTDDIDTSFEKTTGFEPGTDGTPGTTDFTTDATVDRYFTYNLEVTKAITGSLADKNHDFPFQIAITGALTNAVTVDIYNNSTTATTDSVSTTVLEQTAALSDGESYTVTGLPKGTTVTVTEYNDTVDTYKLTTSLTGTTSSADVTAATQLGTAVGDAIGEEDVLINSGDASNVKSTMNTVITFTNDLASISPTGYVARFAPYALILIGGIALLIIAKKHRKHTDEE